MAIPELFVLLSLSLRLAPAMFNPGGGLVAPGEDVKHLPGCVVPTTKVLMEFNETLTLQDNCLLMTCRKDRTIEYRRCTAPEVPPDCTLTDYNRTLPFPSCCPMVQCEDQGVQNRMNFNETEVLVNNSNPEEALDGDSYRDLNITQDATNEDDNNGTIVRSSEESILNQD